MVTRLSLIAAIVLGLFSLTGCGTPPRFSRISARVADLKSTDHGPVLTLHFISTNTIPVVVHDASYTLFLNDQKLGVIESDKPVGIPALGSVDQDVPVPAKMAASINRLTDAHASPGVWLLHSTLNMEWDGDTTAYKSVSEGRLPLRAKTAP